MKSDLLVMGPMFPATLAVLDAAYATHKVWLAPERAAFLETVKDRIRAAATTGSRGMDAATMDALPNLEVIAHFGVGVDSIDVDAARERGIAITNTPDVLTEDVADITLALLLATVRRVAEGDRYVRARLWPKGPMHLTDSVQYGKTVGIVGLGRIGKAIAKRCEAFNLKVAYQGRSRQSDVAYDYYADPVALAKASDILVAACPGGEATRGIISKAVIDALGPAGVFVNIARGSVVDEPALLSALVEGRLGGAGLDVFADEPRVPEAYFGLDNVVLQPHVASATIPTRTAMGQLVIDNLAAFFAGSPLKTPY